MLPGERLPAERVVGPGGQHPARRLPVLAEPGDELTGAERRERDESLRMDDERSRVESEPIARTVVGEDDGEPLGRAGGERVPVEGGHLRARKEQRVEVQDGGEARLGAERIRRAPILGHLAIADECARRAAVEEVVVGRARGVDRPRVARREEEGGAPAPRSGKARVHVGLDLAHDAAEWTAARMDRARDERA